MKDSDEDQSSVSSFLLDLLYEVAWNQGSFGDLNVGCVNESAYMWVFGVFFNLRR